MRPPPYKPPHKKIMSSSIREENNLQSEMMDDCGEFYDDNLTLKRKLEDINAIKSNQESNKTKLKQFYADKIGQLTANHILDQELQIYQ